MTGFVLNLVAMGVKLEDSIPTLPGSYAIAR